MTTVVNNSYELARNYVDEVRNKVQSEIVLIAFDVNKSKKFLNDNTIEYKRFLKTQKLIRRVDEIHIIDGQKKLLYSTLEDKDTYIPPLDQALNLVLDDDRPLKIINAFENRSAAIMRLQNFEDRFIYVVNYLDENISKYLTESQEAINFYYTVEEKSTGIKISFAIIYIIIVSLLLFLSVFTSGTLISKFPSPIEVEAKIKLLIDLKNLDENLIAIDIDINNNNETITIYIIANEIFIPVLFSSTV